MLRSPLPDSLSRSSCMLHRCLAPHPQQLIDKCMCRPCLQFHPRSVLCFPELTSSNPLGKHFSEWRRLRWPRGKQSGRPWMAQGRPAPMSRRVQPQAARQGRLSTYCSLERDVQSARSTCIRHRSRRRFATLMGRSFSQCQLVGRYCGLEGVYFCGWNSVRMQICWRP